MTEKYSDLVVDTILALKRADVIKDFVSNPSEVDVLRDLADCRTQDDLITWANTIADDEERDTRTIMDLLDTIIETTENERGLEALGDHILDPPSDLQEQLPVISWEAGWDDLTAREKLILTDEIRGFVPLDSDGEPTHNPLDYNNGRYGWHCLNCGWEGHNCWTHDCPVVMEKTAKLESGELDLTPDDVADDQKLLILPSECPQDRPRIMGKLWSDEE